MTVKAEYCDERGEIVWKEDPYPFKRKFAVGQQYGHEGKEYRIIEAKFVGEFDDGIIYYRVRPLYPSQSKKS